MTSPDRTVQGPEPARCKLTLTIPLEVKARLDHISYMTRRSQDSLVHEMFFLGMAALRPPEGWPDLSKPIGEEYVQRPGSTDPDDVIPRWELAQIQAIQATAGGARSSSPPAPEPIPEPTPTPAPRITRAIPPKPSATPKPTVFDI